MVMRSINTKFITFTLIIILLCTAIVGGIAIKNMSALSNNDSTDILNLLVQEGAAEMDGILGRVEQSVNVLAGCADDYINSHDEHEASPEFFDELSVYIEPLLLNAANVTDGCIGVYIRFSVDIAAPDAGLFYVKSADSSFFESVPCTDISLYDKNDIEHVGWYYVPRDAGEPTWMLPYYNSNIDEYMISYIIPLYIDNIFIGILGMDIDFTMLEEMAAKVTAYETGHAYLTDKDFNIIYHPTLPTGTTPAQENLVFDEVYDKYSIIDYDGNLYHYNYNGQDKVYTYRPLRNGQNLCIAAPEADIHRNLTNTIAHISLCMLIAIVVFIVITVIICRTITNPLKKLTAAAREISNGDLDIDIDVHTSDEIGLLADTLQKTTNELSIYIDKINRLAYLDALTGVENKTAYDAVVSKLEEKISSGTAEFAVAVLDLNDLKKTNDTLGHYYGDMLITNAARLIENAYVGCPVYRIGGDEFVVILDGVSYTNRQALFRNFEAAIAAEQLRGGDDGMSIACGIAELTDADTCYADVFTRADEAMYENKRLIKSGKKR